MPVNQSILGGLSSATIWYSTPNGFQKAATFAGVPVHRSQSAPNSLW